MAERAFKFRSPVMTMQSEGGQRGLVIIPANAVVTVEGDVTDEKFVKVRYQDQILNMFVTDLRSRVNPRKRSAKASGGKFLKLFFQTATNTVCIETHTTARVGLEKTVGVFCPSRVLHGTFSTRPFPFPGAYPTKNNFQLSASPKKLVTVVTMVRVWRG